MYIVSTLCKCIYNSEKHITPLFVINLFYFYFGWYEKKNPGITNIEEDMFIKPIKFFFNNFILFNILCHHNIIYRYIKL